MTEETTGRSNPFGIGGRKCQCDRCRDIQKFESGLPPAMSPLEHGFIALGALITCFAAFFYTLWLIDLI